jgi:hypothetical protein
MVNTGKIQYLQTKKQAPYGARFNNLLKLEQGYPCAGLEGS